MIHRVRDSFGSYELCLRHERRAGVAYLDLGDSTAARAFARALAHDASSLRVVRSLVAGSAVPLSALDDREIIELLARWLAAGHIWVARREEPLTAKGGGAGDDEVAEAAEGKLVRPKTWIEIELVDMEGQPVPNERYWIQLTDGSIREGRLDAKGRAYFGDLDPGECEVRWPDLDDGALSSPKKGPPPPAAPRTWIEIELVDMEGQPVPYERYWIRLTDGSIRQGRLDGKGRAAFRDLDPGQCEVKWTDLDDSAWSAVG